MKEIATKKVVMVRPKPSFVPLKYAMSLAFLFLVGMSSYAQIGDVIWEDNFDTFNTDYWTSDNGDGCAQGICGWGNQELQSYQPDNISIEDVPGEPGNKALVLEARRENAGNSAYTSGKVITDKKVAVQYGLVEVRLRVPDLEQGLWPAAWMLGTTGLPWPAKGEIDIMEMGFSKAGRDEQGATNSTVNQYVGANAFFAIPDNGGVGNIAFDKDFNTPYVASTPLNDRFVTYRIYWEPTSIRFTAVDNGTEYDLYREPFPISPDDVTAPFTRPFYLLLNLAVGGTLPGGLGNGDITAPLPGKMYVDYVRVSEWNGFGSVEFSDGSIAAEKGPFGVFTENTPTNNKLNFGSDADIFVFSDTFSEGSEAPVEGEEVISWKYTGAQPWFGAGITSLFGKNMSGYTEEGSMKFRIKIPGNISFRIGITDNFTNEQYISFPAGETKYGLVRNGEWGQVEIPLSDFEGLVAFQNLAYMFILSSDGAPAGNFDVAIDDIYWEDGNGITTCVPTDLTAAATINGTNTNQTSLTASAGDTVVLNPGGAQGGSWSWSGPNNFSSGSQRVSLSNIQTANGGAYTATYTNGCGATSSLRYNVTVSTGTTGCDPTALTASATVNGANTNQTSITVDANSSITFRPGPNNAGNWSWTGANNFASQSREATLSNIQESAEGNYTVTFTNDCGAATSLTYTVTVNDVTTGGDAIATLYFDCQFGGISTELTEGRFTNAQLNALGMPNDQVSSLRIRDGYTATLYWDDNFAGQTVVKNSDDSCLVDDGFNDRLSSITIVKNNTTVNPSVSIRIEAESFKSADRVQTEPASEGGENVGFLEVGSFMVWDVNIPTTGSYKVEYRIASAIGGGVIQLEKAGGQPVYGRVDVPNTGGWQNWETVSHTVNLTAGQQEIAISVPAAGYNINWLNITSTAANKAGITDAATTQLTGYPNPATTSINISGMTEGGTYAVYDITGRVVLQGETASEGTATSINIESLRTGLYLLIEQSSRRTFKFAK